MLVLRRLADGQHGCETGIRAFEDVAPFVPTPGRETFFESSAQCRPGGYIILISRVDIVDLESFQQLAIETRLDGANSNELVVACAITSRVRRGAIQKVALSLVPPQASGHQAIKQGHHRCNTIDHCCVYDLSLAGPLRFENRGNHAEREKHTAAAKVAQQIQRQRRWPIGVSYCAKRTRECDVICVVTMLRMPTEARVARSDGTCARIG